MEAGFSRPTYTMRLVVTIVALAAVSLAAQNTPADLIIHNARVYTADESRPQAEAIAIRGDRIVAIGGSADVLALRGPSSTVIDAAGGAVIPGLHDAHGHVAGLGASLQDLVEGHHADRAARDPDDDGEDHRHRRPHRLSVIAVRLKPDTTYVGVGFNRPVFVGAGFSRPYRNASDKS